VKIIIVFEDHFLNLPSGINHTITDETLL